MQKPKAKRARKRRSRRADAVPVTVTVNAPAPRNILQSISDWWYGGPGQGPRSQHMRTRR